MKQGKLLNRLVMLALFGAIAVYLGVYVYRSLSEPLVTTVSYSYSVDDLVETTGYLVRTEQALPGQGLFADVLPAEGEKVARGEAVAYLYRDSAALERRSTLRALELQVEQLEYTMSRAGDERDNAALTEEILKSVAGVRAAVARRELTGLPEESLELKSLVYKREYAYGGDTAAAQAEIERLQGELRALRAEAQMDTTTVTAPVSGVFSSRVDGYESLLTPAMLDTLTPGALEGLAVPAEPDGRAVGKLITDSEWYFACTVSQEEAKRLSDGARVKVRFSRDWSGELSMTVERLSQAENGRVLVIFSSNRALSETTLLRRQTVELVFNNKTGIRVPKEAVRVGTQLVKDETTGAQQEQRVSGVYVMVGAQAEFKSVTILAEGEEFFLVEAAPFKNPDNPSETKKALRPGDEVVVRAEGLYDGKVLRAG